MTFLSLALSLVAEFFIGVEDVDPVRRSGVAVALLGADLDAPLPRKRQKLTHGFNSFSKSGKRAELYLSSPSSRLTVLIEKLGSTEIEMRLCWISWVIC